MSHLVNGHCARLSLTLSATGTAHILRHCAGCKQARLFASSGKFRVNAQKKLIDVWLIYRCTTCEQTWNHAIHERKSVRSLPPAELDAFMRNDADLARHYAALQMMRSGGTAPAEGIRVERRILTPIGEATRCLEIGIAVPIGNGPRLDRVLAKGLMLGRSEIVGLTESGALAIAGAGAKALRRPVLDGQKIDIDVERCPAEIQAKCRNL